MPDLRAGQVMAPPRLVLLRCQEQHCDHLLLKALPEGSGVTHLETRCPRCKTTARWVLKTGMRPQYQPVPREV